MNECEVMCNKKQIASVEKRMGCLFEASVHKQSDPDKQTKHRL